MDNTVQSGEESKGLLADYAWLRAFRKTSPGTSLKEYQSKALPHCPPR